MLLAMRGWITFLIPPHFPIWWPSIGVGAVATIVAFVRHADLSPREHSS